MDNMDIPWGQCQNVYTLATVSERIVDTIEFPPQFSDVTVVFHGHIAHGGQQHVKCTKSPHPEVSFSQIGDDTITALTTLAKILKDKVAERTFPAESSNPILDYFMPPSRQTISPWEKAIGPSSNNPMQSFTQSL
jgi:hypothetical protein